MTRDEWDGVWTRIQALWPEWTPNPDEYVVYRNSLMGESVEMMDAMLVRVKQTYSSRSPALAWFMKERQRIKDDRLREAQQTQSGRPYMSDEEFAFLNDERAAMMAELRANPDRMRRAADSLVAKARRQPNGVLASMIGANHEMRLGLIWSEFKNLETSEV